MPRTDTTALQSLTFRIPYKSDLGEVTFSFTNPEQPHTIISIPEGCPWGPGMHWHERYDEFFRVRRGRVFIRIGEHVAVYTPDAGVMRIPKFVRHDFMRADAREESNDPGIVEVEEWTDPDDGFHEVFFRNIGSILREADGKFGPGAVLQLWTSIAYLDNYVVLAPGIFGHYLIHGVYGLGAWLGWLVGYKSWYEEYTPMRLKGIAAAGAGGLKDGKSL